MRERERERERERVDACARDETDKSKGVRNSEEEAKGKTKEGKLCDFDRFLS